MRNLKLSVKTRNFLIALLGMFLMNNVAWAQLTQHTTTSTQELRNIIYDTEVEGRLYGFNMRKYPQIFVSEDYGTTWRLLYTFTDPKLSPGYTTKAYFKLKDFREINGKVYVNVSNSASYTTDGVYRIDGITGAVTHLTTPNVHEGRWVVAYDIYEENPDIMLFGTQYNTSSGGGLVRSGVYYTTNGGSTWKLIYDSNDHQNIHLNGVWINPDDPQKLYITRGMGHSGIKGGFFISADAGATWTQKLTGNTLSPVAFNPFNTDEMLVGTYMNNDDFEALFRTFDGGATWSEVPVDWSNVLIMDHIADIEYDSNDPNKIIVLEENQIVVTYDGFTTYEEYAVVPGSNYDVLTCVAINPYNWQEMYFAVDGRHVDFSSDGAKTRQRLSAQPTSYDFLSASVGTNSATSYLYSMDGANCYRRDINTDVSETINANGADVVFADATMGERAFLVNTSTGKMSFMSGNKVLYQIPGTMQNVKKALRDPNNASVYWVATNGGLSKIDISTLTNITVTAVTAPATGDITGIHVATGNSNEIYVTQGNKFYKTTNGGTLWMQASTGLGAATIADMVVNPLNHNEFMIAAGTQIYSSSNKGDSWTSLLSGHTVDKLAFSPKASGVLVAGVYSVGGTPSYLLFSANNGESWNIINGKMLHNCHAQSMEFYFGETGYIDTYLASSDMGVVRYRAAYECAEMAVISYPYLQDFENGGMPLCWTQEAVTGSGSWNVVSKTTGTPATTPDNSGQKLRFANAGTSQSTVKLITSKFDLSSVENPRLSFRYAKTGTASGNSLCVYYKSEETAAWTELATYSANATTWTEAKMLLPNKSSEYLIAFEAQTSGSCDIQIDNVAVQRGSVIPCNPPRDLGLVVSNTYGCKAELSWMAPEGNYKASYNLYRNGELLAANLEDVYYTDVTFETGRDHEWMVKTVCEDGESEGVSVTGTCSNECLPPRNFVFEATNEIYGPAIIKISWELPVGIHKALYNVYRDDQLIASEISETTFTDTRIPDGEHTWSVASICNGTESEKATATAVCENQCAPVKGLDFSYDMVNSKAILSWDVPGDLPAGWISVGGAPAQGFSTYSAHTTQSFVAVRWTPEELREMGLHGATLSEIAFVPWTNNATYYLKIYLGGDGTKPGGQAVSVTVAGKDVTPGEWNKGVIASPITIDAGVELWIGCNVRYTGDYLTIGCDAGPQVAGKNMVGIGTNWKPLSDFAPSFNGNFCFGGFITTPDGKQGTMMRSDDKVALTGYNVYMGDTFLGTTTETTFAHAGLAEGDYDFCVTAIYDNGCESDGVCKSFFVGNPCLAPENVTASLSSDWPNCAVEIAWDAARPHYEPKVIFEESFDKEIPSTWLNLDKDGDEWLWKHSTVPSSYKPNPWKGGGCVFSQVRDNPSGSGYVYVSPDNWLVSPAITLSSGIAELKYNVAQLLRTSTQTYYEVLISTSGTDYDDFTVLFSETIAATAGSTPTWFERVIDLGGYTGNAYIAFRHLNDKGDTVIGIQLDEVSVTEQAATPRLYNVYRNGVKIANAISGTSFVDNDFPLGEHEWSVTAACHEYEFASNPVFATAGCDLPRYIITATAGANGSITPSGEVEAIHGRSTRFEIVPDYGYALDGVLVDGVSMPSAVEAGSYTFTNVMEPHTIHATFKLSEYTITSSAGTGGAVSPLGAIGALFGENKTFEIIPDDGYYISRVLVDGVNNTDAVGSGKYTFLNIVGNHTIQAFFEIRSYTITASAGEEGVITPNGAMTLNYGSTQSYSFYANAGYEISRVLIDGVNNETAVAARTYKFTNIAANHVIHVEYRQMPAITSSAGEGGAIIPNGVKLVNHGGEQYYTFVANPGYEISRVMIDGTNNASAVAAGTYTFSNVTTNHIISAEFKLVTYTITASAGAGGTISPSGVQAVTHGGQQSFTITPDAGYEIADVLVDGVSVGRQTSHVFNNVTKGHTISAEFRLKSYTIVAAAGAGGTISPSGTETVAHGTNKAYNITPDTGYEIADVTVDGASIGAQASYTFNNIAGHHIIAATFKMAVGLDAVDAAQLTVYPNPTTGKICVRNSGKKMSHIRVYDLSGRLLQEANNIDNTEIYIELGGYAPGVYFFKIDDRVIKVVKN